MLFRVVTLPSSTPATWTIEMLLPSLALSPNLSLSLWAGISWGNMGHYHSWRESGFSTRLTDPQINTCFWMCGPLPSCLPPSAGGAHFVMLNMAVSLRGQGRMQAWGPQKRLRGPRRAWTRNTQNIENEGGRKRGGGLNTGVQLLVGWCYRLRRSEYGSLSFGTVKNIQNQKWNTVTEKLLGWKVQ